ncbi:phosphocholine cytidylyltransferase family protein [Motilibacter aurantiacus]|uniref:phosphocholine cytidylyltransferase family protein n=1 Tax=Motilibacter aurantiacus TaxID=2714955 RepID=UPI00140A4F82|nr:NTP transferase domain-containing protein [Motilibacter aurantiacus]NHC46235.1 NTP transferase domain-containing protein [Motilibacter aurantiacus]
MVPAVPPSGLDVVVLAAGLGSRLGGSAPKPLTPLPGGETLLGRQLRLLEPLREQGCTFTLVVGHRHEEFRERFPWASFAQNERYGQTNTAKSLLVGLESTGADNGRGALWLNSDVVFSASFADTVISAVMSTTANLIGVKPGRTADEEVKYVLDAGGCVRELSKSVRGGQGEAIGVNLVSAATRARLVAELRRADDRDYFEAAVEASITRGERWLGLDLGDHFAVEVDFPQDLEAASAYVSAERTPVLTTR